MVAIRKVMGEIVRGLFSGDLFWTRQINSHRNIGHDYEFNTGTFLVVIFGICTFLFFMAWMSKARDNFTQMHYTVVEQPGYGKNWLKRRAREHEKGY